MIFPPGPFTDEDYDETFIPSPTSILILGSGGLGCEILKNLSMTASDELPLNLHIIDMDTISSSNLNRQFLFKDKDVGKYKCEIASLAVKDRIKVEYYIGKIEDYEDSFYEKFDIIISGLDSINARKWINETIWRIYNNSNNEKSIIFFDGGTEGFQGSIKIIIPGITACFQCYQSLIPDKIVYPLCTLANTPRLPEHCIEWAKQLGWEEIYQDKIFDYDNDEDVEKMFKIALKRANEFGIEGVTKSLTLGVVKNIIPAIASTNAIISGQLCNEVYKFISNCNPNMKDMGYYNGENGVLFDNEEYLPIDNCPVCGIRTEEIELDSNMELIDIVQTIKDKFELSMPIIMQNGIEIYNFKDQGGSLQLSKEEDVTIEVVDKTLLNGMKVRIKYYNV